MLFLNFRQFKVKCFVDYVIVMNVYSYQWTSLGVISVFSRILERIVHDQLYEFLRANKVIARNQSAFQKLCSMVTSLICSTDSWYENIDREKLNFTIFLDLKKAFDAVDHRIMVEKLMSYGIRGIPGN